MALKAIAARLAQLDNIIWLGIVAIFCCVYALRFWAKFDPEIGSQAAYADSMASVVYEAAGILQGVTATFIVLLPLLKLWFTRNPAEVIAVPKLHRAHPDVIADLRYIIRRGQVPFDAKQLKLVNTEEELDLVNEMNAIAFETSGTYGGAKEDKAIRNASLFKAYPQCFAIIYDKSGARMGFSIVTPLHVEAAQYYKKGHISDLGMAGYHLAQKGENAAALLLFAIGLEPAFEAKRGKVHRSDNIRQLLRCHVLHAYRVAQDFDPKTLEYIAQVEKPSIKRLLLNFGFSVLPGKGKDGDALYSITWRKLAQTLLKQAPEERPLPQTRQA